jgi:hypothetical protein
LYPARQDTNSTTNYITFQADLDTTIAMNNWWHAEEFWTVPICKRYRPECIAFLTLCIHRRPDRAEVGTQWLLWETSGLPREAECCCSFATTFYRSMRIALQIAFLHE